MLKRLLWVLGGLLIALPIVFSLVGIKLMQFKAMGDASAQMDMPPETVNVETVREHPLGNSISSVGTVVAVQGIVVKNEMEGIVRKISFEAGTMVNAGDVLVELDMDIEQSQLRLAEATAEGAARIFKRAQDIYARKGISEADYSSADTNLKEANARLENIRAMMAKKVIRAPFAGKLGIRRISIGQFLDKASAVVSLQKVSPVYVEFTLPQQQLGSLANGLKIIVTSDSYQGEQFVGEITAIEPDVDVTTRNVTVQATLENEDGRLIPGMFVSVEVILAKASTGQFIPATGVQYDPSGNLVYVVEDAANNGQLTVQPRPVTLGVARGDFVQVVEGVSAGERIVSTGLFKLRPGMSVVIDTALAPEFSFTPTPDNT